MFSLLLLACVSSMAAAAPAQLDGDKTLIRTKRSEEAIMFGNHQNFARTKKGDPHPHPMNPIEVNAEDDEDDKLDEQLAGNTFNLSPDPEQLKDEQVKPAKGAAPHWVSRQDQEVAQIERLLTLDAQVDPLTASEDKAEEERILEHLMSEDKNKVTTNHIHSEGLPIAHPEKVLEEEDPTLEEGDNTASSTAPGDVEASSGDSEPFQQDGDFKDYAEPEYEPRKYKENEDDFLFPPAVFKALREKRSTLKSSDSHSLKTIANAEDMMAGGSTDNKKVTGRVKRELGSLSPIELEELLGQGYYDNEVPEEYEEAYYPEEPRMERRSDPAEGPWENNYRGNGEEDMPVFDVDPRSFESQMYMPEEQSLDLNDIDPEEQRRLELLEYLYSRGAQPQFEEGPEYPGDIEESWDDLGPAKLQFGPEPYGEEEQEQEERQMPSKRQYMSFVPGVKREWNDKRNSEDGFYPYQYGPDGRWGAMVPNAEREKRNEMAEYERLYELAQALNGPDMMAQQRYEKRFTPQYGPSQWDDYWDRKRK